MASEFGVVGLGRMGGGLAAHALAEGLAVSGFALGGASEELKRAGLVEVESIEALPATLRPPRVVFLYIPAGPSIDRALEVLAPRMSPGDVIVDGGNSYWGDSIRRARRLEEEGLWLVDLGTSGGVSGANAGACFMVGGAPEAVARIEPILKALAVPGGYVHAGGSGAGHFTKLVHNGIEFGMLQAIGEGMALLEAYPEPLPIADVLSSWRNGSVVRSWLVDLMEHAYREHGGLDAVPSLVDDTGEVNWLLGDALNFEVPVPVISQSVMQLLASRDEAKVAAKAVALMRNGFGGHRLGRDEHVEQERREGRVGDLYRSPITHHPH